MPPTRRLAEEPPERAERPPEPVPEEPALLALQRSAGNAAVTRLLARDALSIALGDAPLAAPNLNLPAGALDDWKAAGERHADGSLAKSIELNQKRFGYTDELRAILTNTARAMGWL